MMSDPSVVRESPVHEPAVHEPAVNEPAVHESGPHQPAMHEPLRESAVREPLRELPYAVPSPSYMHKVLAGAAVVLAGLLLIVLGGCFLIGVMLISNGGFNATMNGAPLSRAAMTEIVVLYALAGAAFVGAVLTLLAGLRASKLYQVSLQSNQKPEKSTENREEYGPRHRFPLVLPLEFR